MFQRRIKLTITQRLRGFIWPHIGWQRTAMYFRYRLVRLPGTPHSIAGGFAIGAAVCFTPLLGFQIALAALLAVTFRVSLLAAVIGTFIGTPWTFPFIWWLVYTTGATMLGQDGAQALPETLGMAYVFDNVFDIFLPMLVGSVPTGIIAWMIFYLPLKKLVGNIQSARRERLGQGRPAQTGNGEGNGNND